MHHKVIFLYFLGFHLEWVSSTPLALHNIGNSMPHTVQHPIIQFTLINIHFEFFFFSIAYKCRWP